MNIVKKNVYWLLIIRNSDIDCIRFWWHDFHNSSAYIPLHSELDSKEQRPAHKHLIRLHLWWFIWRWAFTINTNKISGGKDCPHRASLEIWLWLMVVDWDQDPWCMYAVEYKQATALRVFFYFSFHSLKSLPFHIFCRKYIKLLPK